MRNVWFLPWNSPEPSQLSCASNIKHWTADTPLSVRLGVLVLGWTNLCRRVLLGLNWTRISGLERVLLLFQIRQQHLRWWCFCVFSPLCSVGCFLDFFADMTKVQLGSPQLLCVFCFFFLSFCLPGDMLGLIVKSFNDRRFVLLRVVRVTQKVLVCVSRLPLNQHLFLCWPDPLKQAAG